MISFANIGAHNGWSQAVLGALLVFAGLVLLSLAIAQVKKLVAFIEGRGGRKASAPSPPAAPPTSTEAAPDHCPANIHAVASHYRPLVEQLPSPFPIAQLYELANRAGFPHPYISIKCLREAGLLEPQGDGLFSWNA